MERWTEKAKIVESLNQQVKEIDTLTANIMEASEDLDNAKDKHSTLEQTIAQIKRRIDNIKRDKSRNLESNSVIGRLRQRIKEKETALDEKEEEMDKRKKDLEKEESSLEGIEATVKVNDEKMAALDERVKELDAAVEKAVQELREERDILDQILKTIPIEQQDQFSGLQELLAEIT